MTTEQLCDQLWNDTLFQKAYLNVQLQGAAAILGAQLERTEVLVAPQWHHLLRCASILITSNIERFSEAGLRIIHNALQFSDSSDIRKFAGALLANSANIPALSLAIQKGWLSAHTAERLPVPMQLEAKAAQLAATINFESDRAFVGNKFQQTLWSSLTANDWVSVSAPTSGGKSFLLEKWIEHLVSSLSSSTIFYIVPTRALIGQVEANLRRLLFPRFQDALSVISLPLYFSTEKPHNIFVYTQERYHLYLLNRTVPAPADLIVIDEAHKIGGGRRGVLLQQVLELSAQQFPNAKFLFASPSSSNPEELLKFSPPGRRSLSVSNELPTVNQNLFWVIQKPRHAALWQVEVLLDGNRYPVGEITLPNKPSTTQKLAFLSQHLGGYEGGNVIYVNRASDAETTAGLLSQYFEESKDEELAALSELCEKAVHPEFMLRTFVKHGVAFHYGNIPQLIRTEIERLFSKGKIRYLVCTSTLIEGVNLACRNVFMRNPKRGIRELMTPDDFWNLAGRAGRWGKEFQGSVFCIDPLKASDWPLGQAPSRKFKQRIEIATTRVAKEYDSFLNYVTSGAPNLEKPDRFHEQLLSYFVFRKSLFGDLGELSVSAALDLTQRSRIEDAIDETISQIRVPIEIVRRNPGINPFGMNALYDYFRERDVSRVDELLPSNPLSEDAVKNFVGVFSRITKFLGSARLGTDKFAFATALLVVNWMRGLPLARLIDLQIRYEEKKPAPPSRAAIIRNTMERVETIARFEAPKYLHCYIDILNFYLAEIGRSDLAEDVKDIWVFLEFGVSKRTELSLMSLGLSRSSVMALSEHIADDSLDERGAFAWLMTNNWRERDLARLVVAEIDAMIQSRQSEFSSQPH